MWSGEWRVEATTLLCAVVLDPATREAPPAIQAVVWMGRLIAWLEGLLPAPEREAASPAAGGSWSATRSAKVENPLANRRLIDPACEVEPYVRFPACRGKNPTSG